MQSIIIIGAGVSGLSSGLRLLQAGYSVSIWAKELPQQTTSRVAAAIWYPYKIAPEAKVVEWGRRGYEVFCELAEIAGTGVKMQRGLEFFREPQPVPSWTAYLRYFRHTTPEELLPGYVAGHVFEVPVIEMPIYLSYLQEQFEQSGGRIIQREIASLDEPLAESDLVINCSGLGSRTLLQDEALYPIRGQIMRVKSGAVQNFIFADEADIATYIVPRSNDCILGGTIQRDNWSLEAEPETAEDIKSRCVAVLPALEQAEVLEHLVGLRPGRKAVRLEAETTSDGKTIVHNYGHGGAGVTVSWGCAEEVVGLVKIGQGEE